MKKPLFLEASDILLRTQTALPERVTPRKAKLLREAADALHAAVLVSQAAHPATRNGKRWQKFWGDNGDVETTRRTLLAVANGTSLSVSAIAQAAEFCSQIVDDDMNVYS